MTTTSVGRDTAPVAGSLVRVRGTRWVVAAVEAGADPLVELSSVEDGRYGETLRVVWGVEVGASVIDAGALPQPDTFDPPDSMAAYLDAARWASATSADVYHLQAPFRAGVAIEDYQLEPLARALLAPRVNLLLADDVGLGKTIEAGLVALELLLRHRARTVLIVCPAGLTSKWQDEMAEKFGLDFTLINADECARLRRVRGAAANPFRSHRLMIVSLPWLRTARAQRLLAEALPTDVDPRRRTFDLLILDEAHHVAPSAPQQRYAVDSQQTKLIRSLVPHCEHRLFLSATPHNGYSESFQALLELVDDQRFNRAAAPDPVSQRETVIRRLKADVTAAGQAFLPRRNAMIEVDYTDDERRAYDLLADFVALRRRNRRLRRSGHRTDVVALLLKKRLYSSPAALASTVAVVRAGLQRGTSSRPAVTGSSATTTDEDDWTDDAWAEEFLDADDERDTWSDDERDRGELAALRRAEVETVAEGGADAAQQSVGLLDGLAVWAAPYAHRADSKAAALIGYLRAVCLAGDVWLDERVVVFTEYRDTQLWLEDLLRREGLTLDSRVALLHGGMDDREREALRRRFQAPPGNDPDTRLRILIATDAAAEGIDLHWHCHRLVNYDIPFNPNRLEQRIGRIDRYGQTEPPEVRHFVGAGWRGRGGLDGDTDFLSRIAQKVARVETDLGSANPVLSRAVQQVMLGHRPPTEDGELAAPASRSRLAGDAGVREQVARLRAQLDATVADLGLTPDRVRRLVSAALRLARQAPLTAALDPDPVWTVPPLTGAWARATAGLSDPLRPEVWRPVTFDAEVARQRREDVVYAHLNHPLVAMAMSLMTAAAASGQTDLSRITVVTTDHPQVTEPLAVVYARFLVVGGDAIRLHEEVLHAGGWVRAGGRFARVENLTLLAEVAQRALGAGQPASAGAERDLVAAWPGTEGGLTAALEWRVRARRDQVRRALVTRRQADLERLDSNFARFEATLRTALAEPDQAELPLTDPAELAQSERDQRAMAKRLAVLPREQRAEAARIEARFDRIEDHTFPLGVVFVVPEGAR
ncbi:DISARM system SNF2-like helicase DrmD [uncultured Friedmanniella sp.]|uniref:DISARM system SNF2-like helicase DrmD n=1 Tax=uncultured Friedmanniella sp. TaxID=335381 RepID=UPI0035CB13AD